MNAREYLRHLSKKAVYVYSTKENINRSVYFVRMLTASTLPISNAYSHLKPHVVSEDPGRISGCTGRYKSSLIALVIQHVFLCRDSSLLEKSRRFSAFLIAINVYYYYYELPQLIRYWSYENRTKFMIV